MSWIFIVLLSASIIWDVGQLTSLSPRAIYSSNHLMQLCDYRSWDEAHYLLDVFWAFFFSFLYFEKKHYIVQMEMLSMKWLLYWDFLCSGKNTNKGVTLKPIKKIEEEALI